jgi:LPXTG-site transpeptidase (sortase) family protein
MNKSRNFRLLGNFLLLGGILLFGYIYYPLVLFYFYPHKIDHELKKEGFVIEIPKIKIEELIIPNVDPFNRSIYDKALKEGIAQAKNTSLPGQGETVFLFAHSSGPPWDQTRHNTVFLKLGKLQKGDTITIYRKGKRFNYLVREKKIVWPNEVNYLLDTKKDQLILQTCTPIGTDLQRLLVFADPIQLGSNP